MDLPGLNPRPGRVVAAEILRRFGSSVCAPSSPTSPEFFLVISFGRCLFRLSEQSVASILQAVLGGHASAFRVLQLSDRVFRFSVASPAVRFHVYNLRSFECSQFRIFFHLWNGGGPNHMAEFQRWQLEEAAQWTTINRKGQSQAPSGPLPACPPLTGANVILIRASHRSNGVVSSNSNLNSGNVSTHPRQSRKASVFTCWSLGLNLQLEPKSSFKGMLLNPVFWAASLVCLVIVIWAPITPRPTAPTGHAV